VCTVYERPEWSVFELWRASRQHEPRTWPERHCQDRDPIVPSQVETQVLPIPSKYSLYQVWLSWNRLIHPSIVSCAAYTGGVLYRWDSTGSW
jgi:hypothetical protein